MEGGRIYRYRHEKCLGAAVSLPIGLEKFLLAFRFAWLRRGARLSFCLSPASACWSLAPLTSVAHALGRVVPII